MELPGIDSGSTAWALHNARSAAPDTVGNSATVMAWSAGAQSEPTVLHTGTNGWRCANDSPATPKNDPICMDAVSWKWEQALVFGWYPRSSRLVSATCYRVVNPRILPIRSLSCHLPEKTGHREARISWCFFRPGAYGSFGDRQGLTIRELASGTETVAGSHLLATDPAFSPDGSQVAFRGRDQRPAGAVYFPVRRSQLYRTSVADTLVRLIVTPEGEPGNPSWSPDGQTIYFHLDHLGSVTIWSVDLRNAEPRRIATGGTDDAHPAVSPDGEEILFVRDHRDLHTMPVAGGEPRLVYSADQPTRMIDFPWWTQDGRIVFSVTDKTGNLFLLRSPDR